MANVNKLTEKQFMQHIIELAQINGWKVAHFRAGLTQSGKWRTQVQADGAGFPDLVIVREKDGKLCFIECKSDIGKLTPLQKEWIDTLKKNRGIAVFEWRPKDWDAIVGVLSK